MLSIVKQFINIIFPCVIINVIIFIIIKCCNYFLLAMQMSTVWQQVDNDRSNQQSNILSWMFKEDIACDIEKQSTCFTLN